MLFFFYCLLPLWSFLSGWCGVLWQDVWVGGVRGCLLCRQRLGLHRAAAAWRSLSLVEHGDSQLLNCLFHLTIPTCRSLDFTTSQQYTKECFLLALDLWFRFFYIKCSLVVRVFFKTQLENCHFAKFYQFLFVSGLYFQCCFDPLVTISFLTLG